MTDDVRYWMGSRSNRYPKSSKAIAILDPDRYVEDDLTKEDELAILDETKQTLSQRVARLDTGMAWAEDPPSRSRHLITNIEVEPGDAGERDQSLLEFHGLPQPGGDRAGLLRRCPARRPAPNRGRVEDRRSQSDPRLERFAGQETKLDALSGRFAAEFKSLGAEIKAMEAQMATSTNAIAKSVAALRAGPLPAPTSLQPSPAPVQPSSTPTSKPASTPLQPPKTRP